MTTPPDPGAEQQHNPAPPTPSGISKKAAAFITAGVAVVVGGITALVFTLTGDEDTPAETETFTAIGTMTLTDSSGILGAAFTSGSKCMGDRGYDDIAPGAQITIYDNTGTMLAIGRLGDGKVITPGECLFNFEVPDVPAGHDLYQIEVSHRGKIAFTEEDGLLGRVSLSLG